jgi:trehalose 6-phosphate phosphatase
MSLPFFEYGAPRLDAIVKPGMLCAFDFDGTLAPIMKDPARVCMPAAVSRRLSALMEHAHVAIISGRSVADVGARLEFLPDFVVGNHGIEGIPGWEGRAENYRQLCQEWEQRLTVALKDRALFDPGIWIEHKAYTLSVHYRMARDRPKAVAELLRLFATLMPAARIVGGKCVFNLLPPDAPDKGVALARLCEASDVRSAIYVGDDVTDEDVFRLRREDWLTVRIEHCSDSAAEFHLHHRLDMVQLLDALIMRLSRTGPMARQS